MSEREDYLKAGKIAAEALKKAEKMIKPGVLMLEVAENIERFIREKSNLSFPINISTNNQAAHYTPGKKDEKTFGEKDVVKIDVGTHENGFIGDTALTIDLSGENGKLLEASEQALENALSIIKAGVMTNEISKEIEKTITSYGFKPVRNLGGHELGQYELHAGFHIPNTYTSTGVKLEEGMAIAIEPFASTGKGYVKEGPITQIFSVIDLKPVRGTNARKVLEQVKEYKSFPFAERWVKLPEFTLRTGLRELVMSEILRPYPVLIDERGSLISQAEKTIIVEKDSCIITTNW